MKPQTPSFQETGDAPPPLLEPIRIVVEKREVVDVAQIAFRPKNLLAEVVEAVEVEVGEELGVCAVENDATTGGQEPRERVRCKAGADSDFEPHAGPPAVQRPGAVACGDGGVFAFGTPSAGLRGRNPPRRNAAGRGARGIPFAGRNHFGKGERTAGLRACKPRLR